jgi:hypothetical protein
MEVFRVMLVVTGEFYNTFSRELWGAEETRCHIALSQISKLFYFFLLHSVLYFSLFEILNYEVISYSCHICRRVVSSCEIMHTFTLGGKTNFSFSLIVTGFMGFDLHLAL